MIHNDHDEIKIKNNTTPTTKTTLLLPVIMNLVEIPKFTYLVCNIQAILTQTEISFTPSVNSLVAKFWGL